MATRKCSSCGWETRSEATCPNCNDPEKMVAVPDQPAPSAPTAAAPAAPPSPKPAAAPRKAPAKKSVRTKKGKK